MYLPLCIQPRKSLWLCLFVCIAVYVIFFTVFHQRYEIPPLDDVQEKKLKIYIYPTPPWLNYKLLQIVDKSFINDHGVGHQLPNSEFAFDTDQFALEQYFHLRLLHSTYLTNSSKEADIIYIPFYANMAHLAGEQYGWYYRDFWKWIQANTSLIHKFPERHLIVYGGCEKFVKYFRKDPLYNLITLVMLERNAKRDVADSNIVVAPYPSHVHFHTEKKYQVEYTKKDILVSSSWKTRFALRTTLVSLCQKSKECVHVETTSSYNRSYVFDITARSVFCLSPPGDSATRKAFWDAITLGCINVIYQKNIKYPFDDVLNYENLTVYIPEKHAKYTFNILSAIPQYHIIEKQNYIEKHREKFQYTIVPNYTSTVSTNDAFDMILSEIHDRIT